MNWHEVIEQRALEMDEVIARVLRQDLSKLELVVAWIERFLAHPDYDIHSRDDLQEWLDLIKSGGLERVLKALSDRSDEGRRMRQNSPFVVLMPQDERLRILKKYEALRARTHPAGV